MKLVHVRTITWSCMVGSENKLVQMIIMTKQSVMNKNHVIRSMVYVTERGAVVEWLEQLGYGAESRRIA